MCDCNYDNAVWLRVLVPARHAAEGVDTWKEKPIDRCIAPIVKALNDAEVLTVASCCGHGRNDGSILLTDGREICIPGREDSAFVWPEPPPEIVRCYLQEDDPPERHPVEEGIVCARCYAALARSPRD